MPQDAAPGDCTGIVHNTDPQNPKCPPARMGQTSEAVIHLLFKSRKAACGFHPGEPPAWPSGHLWVRQERAFMVSCPKCQRLLPELLAEQRK